MRPKVNAWYVMRVKNCRQLPVICSLLLFAKINQIQADGIYGNGTSARSMGMAGADVAWASDPLSAMTANPASLANLTNSEVNLGALAGLVDGHFAKPGVSSGDLDTTPQALPEGAIAIPVKKWPITIGLSVAPDSTLLANWHYYDPPGGLGGGTSYGYQQEESEILVLRSALGVGVKLNSQLSLGLSVGLLYNENRLKAPYTFQNLQSSSNPGIGGVDGAKTLLDLQTSGFGWDIQAGLIFQATTNLQFGVSYQSEATLDTTGDADGNPSAQFGASLPFHYDANVENKFPQTVTAGLSWKFYPQWRLALQMDWVNWASAFNTLPVRLSNGNNPTVNSVLAANFQDGIPLNWQDSFVHRAGIEYAVTENFSLRAGYCYGQNPVPDSTLLPLTAAIMEHTISVGAGYSIGRFTFDLAYQYSPPAKETVGASQILSGEYSNSSTEVSAHVLAFTTGIRF
jgi:long-chain fatty acid transport protein